MKYWYLKGADVVGPLSVGEIVNDGDFSAETFVCPEPESANSEAWKPAEEYMQDFGYFLDPDHHSKPEGEEPSEQREDNLDNSGADDLASAPEVSLEGDSSSAESVIAFEEPIQAAAPVFEPKPIIDEPEEVVLAPEPEEHKPDTAEHSHSAQNKTHAEEYIEEDVDRMEETIHARSPLTAPMDDNLLDEIPASAVLSSQEEKQIEQELEHPSGEAKSEEAEMMFNEKEILHKEETSAPKQIFEEEEKPKTEPVLVQPDEAALKPSGEELPETIKQNPGRQILKEAEEHSAALDIDAVLEAQKNEHDNSEPLDTFTASAPVVRIDPEQEQPHTKPENMPEPDRHYEVKEDEEDEDDFYDESSRAEDILSIDDTKEYAEKSSPNHGVLSVSHEPDNGLLSVQESVNNQFIKAAPTTTGNILSSSDGRVSRQKNKRNDLIYIMVMFMFVLIIVASMMMFTSEKSKEENNAAKADASEQKPPVFNMDEPVSRSVIQGIDEGMASPELSEAPVKNTELTQTNGTVEDNTQDLALYSENLVRRYQLKSGETIEQYFNKTYSGAYQTRWGSNILHGSTYVVEFFASKVRSEPIRYMFSVNADSGKIGGMNNAAVDLVGK